MNASSPVSITPYSESDREAVLQTWEAAVHATHHFLRPADFEEIRVLVHALDFHSLSVYCLRRAREVIGFIGVADSKVEMLFLAPEHFGQGLGRHLMAFALQTLGANRVDVNEQNEAAVRFYQKLGFAVYERTAQDDLGYDYPLLRLQLPGTGPAPHPHPTHDTP